MLLGDRSQSRAELLRDAAALQQEALGVLQLRKRPAPAQTREARRSQLSEGLLDERSRQHSHGRARIKAGAGSRVQAEAQR